VQTAQSGTLVDDCSYVMHQYIGIRLVSEVVDCNKLKKFPLSPVSHNTVYTALGTH